MLERLFSRGFDLALAHKRLVLIFVALVTGCSILGTFPDQVRRQHRRHASAG